MKILYSEYIHEKNSYRIYDPHKMDTTLAWVDDIYSAAVSLRKDGYKLYYCTQDEVILVPTHIPQIHKRAVIPFIIGIIITLVVAYVTHNVLLCATMMLLNAFFAAVVSENAEDDPPVIAENDKEDVSE
jgi:hypothetical protein